MQALLTTPGEAGSTHLGTIDEPSGHGVRLRTLEVGVCGTDREISAGEFGVVPQNAKELVLGHEFLGEVLEDGDGFSKGQLVTATVRRSCGHCEPCAEGSPDACDTGDYTERGITRMHGFAREVVFEDPSQLIGVPQELGRSGVLSEPTSISARGIRHALTIGDRQVWRPRRSLVIGAGAIGMLATYMLRLHGHEVWTASLDAPGSERAKLAKASGARYVSSEQTPLPDLRDDVGGFDVVIEAAGDAQLMLDTIGLLRRNGVACLLGIDGHPRQVSTHGPVIGVDAVLGNRVVFGSVNAHHEDWQTAVEALGDMRDRWPDALEQLVGLRVPPDRFEDAFDFDGVKATLVFG